MTTPPVLTPSIDKLAVTQGEDKAAELPDLSIAVLGMVTRGEDDGTYQKLMVRYSVTNTTPFDLGHLVIRAQLLTAEGVELRAARGGETVTILAGDIARFDITFHSVESLYQNPKFSQVLVAIEVTGCDCGYHPLGELAVPGTPDVCLDLPTATLPPALRLVSGRGWWTEVSTDYPGEKACDVKFECQVHNLTAHTLPVAGCTAVVTDKEGRELMDAGTLREVPPHALVTLQCGGSTPKHRLHGAKVALALSGCWPVARGSKTGMVNLRLRGRRPQLHPEALVVPSCSAERTGLHLLCTARMDGAWYQLRGGRALMKALRRDLEGDLEGTLSNLIVGDLLLDDLRAEHRQLFDLPQAAAALRPLAIRGEWIIEHDVFMIDLEADWLLPLMAPPADADELRESLIAPGNYALYVVEDNPYGLEFGVHRGSDVRIKLEGAALPPPTPHRDVDTAPFMTTVASNHLAALQLGGDPLCLPALNIELLRPAMVGARLLQYPKLTIRYAVANTTALQLKCLEARAQLLTLRGLILSEAQVSHKVAILPGESSHFSVSFDLNPRLPEMDADQAWVVIEVTACTFGECPLGELELPKMSSDPTPLPTATLPAVLRLHGGNLTQTKGVRKNERCVEVNALVHNLTRHYLPKVKLTAVVIDPQGQEVMDVSTSQEVHPGTVDTMFGLSYVKAQQLKGAKVSLALSGYWPVARGIVSGKVDILSGTPPLEEEDEAAWAQQALAGNTGLTLSFTATLNQAYHHLSDDEEEKRDFIGDLELDLPGTLSLLIVGDLRLDDLKNANRQLIDLPPEVTTVRPQAVRGEWHYEGDVFIADLEADWLLPLKTSPADEDALRAALMAVAEKALLFSDGNPYGLVLADTAQDEDRKASATAAVSQDLTAAQPQETIAIPNNLTLIRDALDAIQLGGYPMGISPLEIIIQTAKTTRISGKRKSQATIGYAIHNPSTENLEHVKIHADLITAQGFYIKGLEATSELSIPAGETVQTEVCFQLMPYQMVPGADQALVVVRVDASQQVEWKIGEVDAPQDNMSPEPLPFVNLEPTLRLVSSGIWEDNYPGFGVRYLLHNPTRYTIPEVSLSAIVKDQDGDELVDIGSRQQEITAGALVILGSSSEHSLDEEAMRGAKVDLTLRCFRPVASGLGYGIVTLHFGRAGVKTSAGPH